MADLTAEHRVARVGRVSGTESSVLLEVESGGARAAMRAFVAWAGEDVALKALFTPDALIAIDVPGRRGVLLDEIWYVTVWIDEGTAAIRACLDRELPDDQDLSREKPPGGERRGEDLLTLALRHGRPAREVRQLL
jgi:hypothetical protein